MLRGPVALAVLALGGCRGSAAPSSGNDGAVDVGGLLDATIADAGVDGASADVASADRPGADEPPGVDASDAPATAAPDASDVAPPRAVLVVDRSQLEFAESVGCEGTATVRLSNAGSTTSGPLSLTAMAPFALGGGSCSGLALSAGDHCDVEVRFRPASLGTVTGALTVTGAPGEKVEVSLRGVGLGVAPVHIQPSLVDFGGVRLGTAAASKLTVSTVGSNPQGPVVNITAGPDFAITRNGCAGTSNPCEIEISFTPAAVGRRSAELVAAAPACGGATASATLTGTGVAAPIGPLVLNREAIDFGNGVVGCWTDATVRALYTGAVATTSLVVQPPALPFGVSRDGCTGHLVAPGGTCDIEVRFKPTRLGTFSGALTVTSGSEVMDRTLLQGSGLQGEAPLVASPSRLQFGAVPAGTASTAQTVTVTEPWGVALPALSTRVVGADFKIVRDTCAGAKVPGHGTCQIDLVFQPASVAERSGELIVTVPTYLTCDSSDAVVSLGGWGGP